MSCFIYMLFKSINIVLLYNYSIYLKEKWKSDFIRFQIETVIPNTINSI